MNFGDQASLRNFLRIGKHAGGGIDQRLPSLYLKPGANTTTDIYIRLYNCENRDSKRANLDSVDGTANDDSWNVGLGLNKNLKFQLFSENGTFSLLIDNKLIGVWEDDFCEYIPSTQVKFDSDDKDSAIKIRNFVYVPYLNDQVKTLYNLAAYQGCLSKEVLKINWVEKFKVHDNIKNYAEMNPSSCSVTERCEQLCGHEGYQFSGVIENACFCSHDFLVSSKFFGNEESCENTGRNTREFTQIYRINNSTFQGCEFSCDDHSSFNKFYPYAAECNGLHGLINDCSSVTFMDDCEFYENCQVFSVGLNETCGEKERSKRLVWGENEFLGVSSVGQQIGWAKLEVNFVLEFSLKIVGNEELVQVSSPDSRRRRRDSNPGTQKIIFQMASLAISHNNSTLQGDFLIFLC